MTQAPFMRAAPAAPDIQGLRIPDRTLVLLRDLVNAHTGTYYDDARLGALRDKLAPLTLERGFDSLLDYYYLLKYDGDADREWRRVIDALSVPETYFWRESDQIQAVADHLLPRLLAAGRRRVRIWSIPCATGEEPLSLAMALEEQGWFDRLEIELHASDASEAALRKAAAGHYGVRAFRQLPVALREKYFDAVPGGREWQVRKSLHARVTSWTRVNIVRPDEMTRLAGSDIVFCRNLFIYFAEATIRAVTGRLADGMTSPGFLCVGAAESLLRLTTQFDLQDVGGAYVYVKS